MELKWIKKGENSIVVVMPTANTEQDFTQRAIKTFREMDYDILCVQDSGSEFSFAKSMNEGINEVLKNPEYLLIGLSNDDVYSDYPVLTEAETGRALPHADVIFLKTDNHKRNTYTSSTLHYLFNMTVLQKAPFHALRQLKYIKSHIKHKKFIIPIPSFIEMRCVQPTAFFYRSILKEYRFDENLKNGVEDDDLMYRLLKKGVTFAQGGTIHHITGASFKPLKQKDSNNYYGNKTHLLDNIVYFSDKHTEE
jgi:hypothetical protein